MKAKTAKIGKAFNATLLVAGTCVGGGILALPVEAGAVGFFPAAGMLFLAWIFMTLTGLLYAEASLWMKEKGAHVVTISKHLLGRWGEVIAVLLYLFMSYTSLVAYNSGGSLLIVNFVEAIMPGLGLSRWEACMIFSAIFGSVFYFGAKILGDINTLFVIGMIIAYFAMVSLGIGGVREGLLMRMQWGGLAWVIPLMLTTFSFQMIVPSLALYLNHEAKPLKNAIIMGTTIPAIVYGLWLLIILGIVPNEGKGGLAESLQLGVSATESIKAFTQSGRLAFFAEYFAFFAIVTSYFGIGLGLYDFLADLTKIRKKGWGKAFLALLVILPTLYFAVIYPNAFLVALDITGGLGDSLLNGVIPVLMVWIGRYVIGYEGQFRLWGGKTMLTVLFACALAIFGIQIAKFF